MFAIDGHLVDHGRIDGQGEFQIIDGIEDAFFIFLHVLVVGHGDALHHGQDAHEVAVEPARLAADEFADVGILLLGHDGRARAVGIVEFDELEFRTGPEDEFFRQTAEVHHQDGCEFQEGDDVVPVADGIETVVVNLAEMQGLGDERLVEGIRRASQGTGAEGHDIGHVPGVFQVDEVTGQHGEIGHEVVAEENRLSPLEVGIARHDDVAVLFCSLDQRFLELDQELGGGGDFAADIHVRIQGDLIVAATAGMQALACFADGIGQSFFDVHVDVFQLDGEIEVPVFDLLENSLQALDDGVFVFLGDDALFGQHRRMGNAAADIFSIHAAIELDGRIEFFYTFIRGLGKTAAP